MDQRGRGDNSFGDGKTNEPESLLERDPLHQETICRASTWNSLDSDEFDIESLLIQTADRFHDHPCEEIPMTGNQFTVECCRSAPNQHVLCQIPHAVQVRLFTEEPFQEENERNE